MPIPLDLLVTVFLYAIVQSLFGVGLLVFGTPTLLLLGYPFERSIALLLPASIVISTVQVIHGRAYLGAMRKEILLYSLPFVAVGLVLVVTDLAVFDVRLLVGFALLLTASTRLLAGVRQTLAAFLKKYSRPYLMLMGFLHGVSNMGGGFLTIFVTTLREDKDGVRANIAYGYLLFASSQTAVLALLRPDVFSIDVPILAALALATYATLGRLLYVKSSRSIYQQMITGFMLAYGVVLVAGEIW